MPASKRHKILVIEDAADQREILVTLLIERGFDVFEAENGRDGFLLSLKHELDAVITDLHMDDGNGVEFLQLVNGRWPNLPVIFVTGQPDSLRHADTLDRVSAVFTKPVDYNRLIEALSECIRATALRAKAG